MASSREVLGWTLLGGSAVAIGVLLYKYEEGKLLALPQVPQQINPPTSPYALVSVALPRGANEFDVMHTDAQGNISYIPGTLINGIPGGIVRHQVGTQFVVSTSLPKSAAPGGFVAHVRVRACRSLGILGDVCGPWSPVIEVRFVGE
jgi:hypothetical protein